MNIFLFGNAYGDVRDIIYTVKQGNTILTSLSLVVNTEKLADLDLEDLLRFSNLKSLF